MRKIIILFVFVFLQINIYAIDNSTDSYEDLRTYPNASMFQIDDSLLSFVCPNAGTRPLARPDNLESFLHSLKIHFSPNNSNIPNFLIISNNSLYTLLSNEIRTYAEDVHAVFGYGIYVETVQNPTPEDVKSLIVSYNNLCGVLFIGDVGECMYEVSNDHDKYGYRKWPCDLFYMDLDGIWTDSDSNGIYDGHSGNVAPDIFLGRLSTSGLSYGNESDLIRRQLQKSHDFWWKSSYHAQSTTLNYIDKDWEDDFFSPNDVKMVFSTLNITDVRYSTGPNFSTTDYLSKISSNTYGFTHLAAHSSPIHHAFTNGSIYNSNIYTINSKNYAYGLFCCSACNWTAGNSNGYLGGAYLFNNGKTIAIVGSSKTGGMWDVWNFYPQLASKNLGKAFLYWWNQYGNNHSNSCIYWNYGMTILGDPLIDFRYMVSNTCVNNLSLTTFPSNNSSNLILYKAGNKITISGSFVIPQGVHVIFDAPQVVFEGTFSCPLGASFETRSEGCEL